MTFGLPCDREGYDLNIRPCKQCGSRGMPPWAIYLGVAVGILLSGIATGMIVSDYRKDGEARDHFAKWPQPYSPISINGKTFRNEKVILDGRSYSHCKFYNVTFVYNGTTTIQFSHNEIYGPPILASDNQAVQGAYALTVAFNLLKNDVQLLDLPSDVLLERGKNANTPQ